ncbi:hypothetical protein [Microbacterium sp.]|uniref:hypothetical protein n=1 Tax=Microbacterium sp. TaxID=51671 RepID=UPI0039E5C98C
MSTHDDGFAPRRTARMPDDIGSIVDAARAQAFVGRAAELALFRDMLDGSARRALFVHGVGGLGKTALLQQFRGLAQAAGRAVIDVDGEHVGGSEEALRAATADAAEQRGCVMLIDAYERLTAIDDWVREELVAALPADALIVLAGREPPSPGWTEAGWRAVTASRQLHPLDDVDSRLLLVRAGAPTHGQDRLVALGRGHPLTLAMLAASVQAGALPEGLDELPDIVAALAARLVDEAPDDDHALAMSLCAHVWLTTQDLIEELLERRAPEVWRWLERRPWTTRGTHGLYPHDLVRDVLGAELRQRSPATYRRIHRFVSLRSAAGLRSTDGAERRLWAHQKLFLHQRSPLAASFWTMRRSGTATVSEARATEHEWILEHIRQKEGGEGADIATRWFAAQPDHLAVALSARGVEGFLFTAVCGAEPDVDDPVTRRVLDHAQRTAPARPGEVVSVARFLGGREGDERDPHAVVVASVSSLLLWTSLPLAWSFATTTDAEFWGPAFDYLALQKALEVDFGGRRHTMYGIDWRRLPPERWLELESDRALSGTSGPPPQELLLPAPLSRDAFAAAVKDALRELHRPDLLRSNPLIGSRIGSDVDGASPELLHAGVVGAVEELAVHERDRPLARVLDRTFVHAAPNQEAAAEILDLPFSTYRRHLARAQERLAEVLWSIEIGERPPARTEHQVSTDRSGL